jgi:oligopeptide transport system permease protein
MSTSKSLWYDAYRRLKRNRGALISGAFIILMCIVALLAKPLAPYSFETQNMDLILAGPSAAHWLGTDDLGRDLLSRLIYGAQMSMAVGIFTAIFSLAMGVVYGAIAGWAGGRIDATMMRFVDILDSIPTLVLLILVKILFDAINVFMNPELRSLVGVLLALSIFGWIMLARVVRGQVLQVKQMLYVEASRALGASSISTLFKQVLPNIMGPIIVVLTFQIPSNIMFESFLSFIGLGLQPPYSSWGVLANAGWKTIKTYPHLIIAPGVALFLTMLAFNLFGDGLRDAFDPKMK